MSDDRQFPSPRASSGARRAPAAAPHSRRGRPRARRDGGLPGVASVRDHEPRRLVPLDSDACLRGACRPRPRPVRLQPVGRRRATGSPRPAWDPQRRRAHSDLQRGAGDPGADYRRGGRARAGARDLGPRRRRAAGDRRAGCLARCPVPRAADARARQGGERQLCAWRRRRRDPGVPGCRSRRRARLPARHARLLRRQARRARPDAAGLLQRHQLRARQRTGLRGAVPRADPLLSAAPAREEPVERGLLVRHQRARASRGAPGGRWRSNRHDHRGHPHDHPAAPGGLADGLSQRGAGAWPRGRRRRPVPASAQPMGDRRDAGPPDRESTHGQRPDGRPAARLRRDPARLVRLLAHARLPCPAAARPDLRKHSDHRRWAHVRHRLRRHVRAPAGGALPARPRGVSARSCRSSSTSCGCRPTSLQP